MIVVGLMSGASVEGINVAVCEITGAPPSLRAEALSDLTIPWPVELRKLVLEAWTTARIEMDDLCLLDVAVGEAFAAAALEGIAHAGFYPEQVDLIGLQGQLVRERIRGDGHMMGAIQLGQSAIVTEWTGITTIGHFRQRDIAAGGQGAPLIGYVDWLLLRHPRYHRAVLYLDDAVSLSFVPSSADSDSEPLAFDVGPGMVLIEYAESRMSADLPQHGNGHLAATGAGTVNDALLDELLTHPYLKRRPPKAVGNAFDPVFAAQVWEKAYAGGVSPAAILETFVAFTVASIGDAMRRFLPEQPAQVILGGKGRHYPHLVRWLREALKPMPLLSHEDVGMDSESKYALGVAVLAYESWHHRPATLPSLTGVQHPVPLGCIIPGANYQRLLQATWQPGK